MAKPDKEKNEKDAGQDTVAETPQWKDEAANLPKKLAKGVETMFKTSYRVHMDLSSLADAKANILISINGIIISIIIASISPKIDSNPWLLIPTSILLLTCLVSIIYAVRAARPRVSSTLLTLDDIRENRANILFFGHFVNLSQDDYLTGMMEILQRPDVLYSQMTRDIYGLGSVLIRKFELLRVAYTVFMIGLTIGILTFIGVLAWVVFEMNGTLL
ncbi:MAG: hypothetical protein ACI9W4_001816 [Rhodothermales bacterium]|jgi:hypothetical protein